MMPPRRKSLVTWILGVLCGVLGHSAYREAERLVEFHAFESVSAEISQHIERIGTRPPDGWSQSGWDDACMMLDNGFANACFSPVATSVQSLRDLEQEFRMEYLPAAPSTQLLLRMWDRIGECSPAAFKYCTEKRELLLQVIEAAGA